MIVISVHLLKNSQIKKNSKYILSLLQIYRTQCTVETKRVFHDQSKRVQKKDSLKIPSITRAYSFENLTYLQQCNDNVGLSHHSTD